MHERLTGMGMNIDDNDFFHIILGSLPESYNVMMHAVTAAATATGTTLSPTNLITIIKSEYDRRKSKKNGNSTNGNN
jgi:hypothetical protein